MVKKNDGKLYMFVLCIYSHPWKAKPGKCPITLVSLIRLGKPPRTIKSVTIIVCSKFVQLNQPENSTEEFCPVYKIPVRYSWLFDSQVFSTADDVTGRAVDPPL